jgi:BirA family biotin operon repressor/biotin-[acetyl-CoA-carboxylase] ligase
MTDIPSPDEVRHFETRCVGRRVWVYERLDSTNTLALALAADPGHDGLVLLAHEQTAGRGQYGRHWHAAPGSSVLMSALLFPPPPLRRPAILTSWAAVAVTETVNILTGHRAQIKWPNDVFLNGKKICGILIEQRNTGHPEHPLAVAAGIGLNVKQTTAEFQQAGLTLAGSLASQTSASLASDDVARALIDRLDEHYDRLLHGDTRGLESQWRERLELLGQSVRIEGLQQDHLGRLVDVNLVAVQLECVTGEVVALAPETIRRIHRVDISRAGAEGR